VIWKQVTAIAMMPTKKTLGNAQNYESAHLVSGSLVALMIARNVVLLIMEQDMFMGINATDMQKLNNLGLVKKLQTIFVNYEMR
jgi:hypothetical protein